MLASKAFVALRLALIAGGLAVLAIVPTALLERMPNVCLFDRFFGIDCLGCGMTRALSMALHGDWVTAQALNPLASLVLLLAFAWFTADAMLLVDRQRGARA